MSAIGQYHQSFNDMWLSLPHTVIKNSTSATIALIIDAMWQTSKKSKAIAENEAIENGFVWDHKNNEAIELSI